MHKFVFCAFGSKQQEPVLKIAFDENEAFWIKVGGIL
jgi:hypothetical protein